MATSETTNLQLVKYGAGTDNFIRTDYNGNLEKIDTFAGNTNEAIANLNNKIYKDLPATTDLNTITEDGIYNLPWVSGGSNYHRPGNYGGMLFTSTSYKSSSGTNDAKQQLFVANEGHLVFVRGFDLNQWSTWEQLALKSDVTTLNQDTYGTGNVVYRVGRLCFITCVAGAWYNDSAGATIRKGSATGTQWVLPVEYRPINIVEIKEANLGKRITIGTDGAVTCSEAISNSNLRFSGCWVSA